MLRAHAWEQRGTQYVCIVCRHGVALGQQQQRQQLRTFSSRARPMIIQHGTSYAPAKLLGARPLSTTTPKLQAEDGPAATPKPAVFSNARGGFGGFGSKSGQFAKNKPEGGGLLPHEIEARKKMASAAATQATASATESAQAVGKSNNNRANRPRAGPRKHMGDNANLSRSVLADVFRSNREPGSPPTPKSWTSSPGKGEKETTGDAKNDNAAAQKSGQSGRSVNRFGAEKVANSGPQTQRHHHGGTTHAASRKPDGKHGFLANKNPGNTAAWAEITKAKRSTKKPMAGGHRHEHGFKGATGAADENDQSEAFWGELEDWATTLKEQRAARGGEPPKRVKGKQPQELTPSDADHGKSINHYRNRDLKDPRRRTGYEDKAATTEGRSKKAKRQQDSDWDKEDWDDESAYRQQQSKGRHGASRSQQVKEPVSAPILLPEYISASNLAQALQQRIDGFMRDMEEMGFENVTSDTIMTGETAALIAMEYGYDPTVDSGSKRDVRPAPIPKDITSLPPRPPVVTIMGHVDHGKTTLLDWLRKSSVAAQEHGGITQHIGAFVVKLQSGKQMTFLDTPGHAAFLTMRQRGAHVTDIVVLVVAADDSVKPQTLEALKHARAAKVPIIVAINKIDKEDARIEQVKTDLSRNGVEIEDYGGDVQVVCVSGKTGQGMEDLEENIITLSEVLDVRAEQDGMAEGWVLESSIKQFGKTATVLVKRGTLRTGDFVVAGKTWARIRALRNEAGQQIVEAPPGTPVEVFGWRDELPPAGEMMLQAPDESKAKSAIEYRLEMAEREQSSAQLAEQEQRQREKAEADAAAAAAEASGETIDDGDSVPSMQIQNFTVKADVAGSVEAVCASVLELGNHEVRAKVLRSSAGPITEFDIDHAATSNSVIINFNNPISPQTKRRAEDAKVQILDHSVIYHVIDDAKATLSKLLPDNVSQRVLGEADVLQVFSINVRKREFKNIAGCKIRNGAIKRVSNIRVLRKGKIIFEGKVDTLKHVKKDVMEMGKGSECGIGLEEFQEFQVDDQLQTFEEIREKRSL